MYYAFLSFVNNVWLKEARTQISGKDVLFIHLFRKNLEEMHHACSKPINPIEEKLIQPNVQAYFLY